MEACPPMNYDVFNGDADGICALHQLRLAQPIDAELITGVKRDNNLLAKINPQLGDYLTVLDISFDRNRNELIAALNNGAEISYFDHHYAGEIPKFDQLTVHIDTRPEICTSLIVNRILQKKFSIWSAVGAYGDNLHEAAEQAVTQLDLSTMQIEQLKQLGIMLNYNGYGIELRDLHFHPAELYRLLHPYKDPFVFIHEEPAYQQLVNGYQSDIELAVAIQPSEVTEHTAIIHFPDASWANRVSGVYGNKLAMENPNRAHALFTELKEGGYRVSVRAPLADRTKADIICRQFKSGGGRAAAAGINQLEVDGYSRFIELFKQTYAHD